MQGIPTKADFPGKPLWLDNALVEKICSDFGCVGKQTFQKLKVLKPSLDRFRIHFSVNHVLKWPDRNDIQDFTHVNGVGYQMLGRIHVKIDTISKLCFPQLFNRYKSSQGNKIRFVFFSSRIEYLTDLRTITVGTDQKGWRGIPHLHQN